MKSIITFYTKAKAFESLSSFYESCSQVEIDEYRDYEKALSALREALKHMVKARAANKEERCKQLQQKIYLVDRFVEARKVTTPLPALAPAVRVPLGSDRMCGFFVCRS